MKTIIRNTSIFVVVVYFILVIMFAVYFNYLFYAEHGFWTWFFFGEVIATLKALVWPYAIFFGN